MKEDTKNAKLFNFDLFNKSNNREVYKIEVIKALKEKNNFKNIPDTRKAVRRMLDQFLDKTMDVSEFESFYHTFYLKQDYSVQSLYSGKDKERISKIQSFLGTLKSNPNKNK